MTDTSCLSFYQTGNGSPFTSSPCPHLQIFPTWWNSRTLRSMWNNLQPRPSSPVDFCSFNVALTFHFPFQTHIRLLKPLWQCSPFTPLATRCKSNFPFQVQIRSMRAKRSPFPPLRPPLSVIVVVCAGSWTRCSTGVWGLMIYTLESYQCLKA